MIKERRAGERFWVLRQRVPAPTLTVDAVVGYRLRSTRSRTAEQLCLHGTGPAFSFWAVALIGPGHGLTCEHVGLCQSVWDVSLTRGKMKAKK